VFEGVEIHWTSTEKQERIAMNRKAAVSDQQSAISENQHQKRLTTEDTEEGKTLPPIHGKPGQKNADEQECVRQRAEALVRRLGETCDELDRLAEENPELVGRVACGAEEHKEAYLRLKARLSPQPAQNRRGPGTLGLKLADEAPRCRWVRQDGTACGSPQMKRHIYCFAHMQMMEAQALALSLPAPEDANAIMIGIMRIQKALIEDAISTKKAGLLLYSMQLALQNVGQTTFAHAKTEDAVRETVSEQEALSSQHSAVSQHQNQSQREVEFVPVPGGHGFQRVRLKIEPELGTERGPVQPVIAGQEPREAVSYELAQPHAVLG
jgi:hypothetical protein